MDQVVSAHSAGGRLSEQSRRVEQAWHAPLPPSTRAGSVTFVGYVLDEAGRPSRLGHKVDLVRRVPRWARSEVTCIRLAVKPEPSVRLRE